MVEPPVVLAVPGVTLMMGEARVTEICATSLSNVTVRGEEMTFDSEYVFRKCNTALTPSALRKAVEGLKKLPLLRLPIRPGLLRIPPIVPGVAGVVTIPLAVTTEEAGVPGVPATALLPIVTC